MFKQADAFDKAAKCEQLMISEPDEVRKSGYRVLRDMWVALANEASAVDQEELGREIAAIDLIQTTFQRVKEK